MSRKQITEAELRKMIHENVSRILKESFEMGAEDSMAPVASEENSMDPMALGARLINEIQKFMNSDNPELQEMQNAIRPDRVENATPEKLMGWMSHTISKHPEFQTPEAVMEYILKDLMNGGLPSSSFAKNFFTKEANNMYFSKNDVSHHNDAEKKKQVERDPSRLNTPMQGRMMNQKIAGLPETIAENVLRKLRSL